MGTTLLKSKHLIPYQAIVFVAIAVLENLSVAHDPIIGRFTKLIDRFLCERKLESKEAHLMSEFADSFL